ncbi:trypsin-like peptidase domain-containing protein [Candidatus Dependentiae bacterium]|nr:trypsin-like peptidase domain-containing protein [Candidatus Dependentiae bacterium]
MNVGLQKIISIISLATSLAVVGGVFWLYREVHSVKNTMSVVAHETPAEHKAVVKAELSEVVSEQNAMKRQLWATLQAKYKNAVCQVFSQITEFNWIEPYKTPSQTEALGSAFFINDGELITNAHVVDQAILVNLQIPALGKRRFKAHIIGVSPERDLALLRLEANELATLKTLLKVDTLPFLTMGESDQVQRGDKIMTLGYPLGQQGLKSTTGVVAGFEHLMGQYFIQIDAPINKGNSGGPSLDYRGYVIGVNSAGIQGAQNVGYIIPSNEVAFFLDQLSTVPSNGATKILRKPYLGVAFNNATENLTAYLGNPHPGGLYVVDVYKGSPFDKAGIRAGDMVYKINDNRLDIYGEMRSPWRTEDRISIVDYVSRLKLGDMVKLEYYRKSALKKTSFTLTQTEPPIRRMYPGYEKIDYDVLAGFVIMPITLNHVILLAQFAPELMQYADLKKQIEPALLITHVMLNSPASRARTVGAGGIISEINGQRVKTLSDLRAAVKKSLSTNYLTIKTTDNQFAALPLQEILDDEPRLSSTYFYTISDLYRVLKNEQTSKPNGDK